MRQTTDRQAKRCWLCGKNGSSDPLDRHHIFQGPLRDKSEKYGAVVYLCHDACHENGKRSAHRCRETRDALMRWGQRKVMDEQNWTIEDFISVFGKNYLDDE